MGKDAISVSVLVNIIYSCRTIPEFTKNDIGKQVNINFFEK